MRLKLFVDKGDGVQPEASASGLCADKNRRSAHPCRIFSQNCRGIKTAARITEFLAVLRRRHAFAACLQETWREGQEAFEEDGWLYLGIAPPHQQGRGSRGVGMVLSPAATAAWKASGSDVWYDDTRARAMALRMTVRDAKRKPLGLLLISGYAPNSASTAAEWDEYYDTLEKLIRHRHKDDMVIFGSDCNASVGRGEADSDAPWRFGALGPHGLEHTNDQGKRLRCFMELHSLASTASFFKKPSYGTWMHPSSHRIHQLDHIMVSRADVRRLVDAGSCRGQLIDSDHRAVHCKVRVRAKFRRPKAADRAKLTRIDYTSLDEPKAREAFARAVLDKLNISTDTPFGIPAKYANQFNDPTFVHIRDHFLTQHGDHWWENTHTFGLFLAACEIASSTAVPDSSTPSSGQVQPSSVQQSLTYGEIADAAKAVSMETLPSRPRSQPPWFAAHAEKLHSLIAARNAAVEARYALPTRATAARLQQARAALQRGVRAAKSEWILSRCSAVNDGIAAARGSHIAWEGIKELRDGLMGVRRKPAPTKMRRGDGSLANTAEEAAGVFAQHFESLYGRQPTFDPSVIDSIPQRPTADGLDHEPSDLEITHALGRLRNTGPGDSGLCARIWKALGSRSESFALVRQIVINFWRSEEIPEEWAVGLLKILPKKGDLSQPGNYRGIMLLEVAYKIVANILLKRLSVIRESPLHLDHESQNGFRGKRGCSDGSFTLKQLIRKRREHGLETWLLFADLVKAFDRVPRELLWKVMLRFGVPTKLVDVLKAMHARVDVKFEIDGVTRLLSSIIGVKQGDLLGPELFTFFMAAVMESWRALHSYDRPTFRTREDFVMTGRRHNAAGDEFNVGDSEYADDTGMAFCSRADVVEQAPKLLDHFEAWGMEIHSGTVSKASKTEVLFCAAPPQCYTDRATYDNADLSDITLPRGRHLPVVDRFSYLGDIIARDGSDALAVDARRNKGSKAFGALRGCVFASSSVSYAAKKAAYEGLVLSIQLYGSESWCLTERLLQPLRTTHHDALRSMCRISRMDTWQQHISPQQLAQRLDLKTIDHYVTARQLRWLGHVSRMPFSRLPRRMLSAWVRNPRPPGAPAMTYGRTIRKALDKFSIPHDMWAAYAADRGAWRETLRLGHPAIRRSRRIAGRTDAPHNML